MKNLTIRRTLLVAVLVAPLSIGSASADSGAGEAVEKMEHHWQALITEPDAAKRQAMMMEHEKMMEQAQGMMMHRDMHTPAEQADLQHTIEMHRSMMDMMR